jgi:hypothetical protein
MAVTNDGGILRFFCHRAACHKGGSTLSDGSMVEVKKQSTARPMMLEAIPKWIELPPLPVGCMYDAASMRIAIPIRDYFGSRIGWVLRWFPQVGIRLRGAKAYNRMDDELSTLMSWYGDRGRTRVMVVEDIPSAYVASEYMDSVCILGTALSIDKLRYMLKVGVKEVVIALDEDATAKAFSTAQRVSILFDKLTVQPLMKDIKDMNKKELDKLFKGVLQCKSQ